MARDVAEMGRRLMIVSIIELCRQIVARFLMVWTPSGDKLGRGRFGGVGVATWLLLGSVTGLWNDWQC